jgi:hypothetical protein
MIESNRNIAAGAAIVSYSSKQESLQTTFYGKGCAMFRKLILIAACTLLVGSAEAEAHGFWGRGTRSVPPRDLGYGQPGFYRNSPAWPARVPSGGPGYSNIGNSGFGYIYDPYISGRFRAPDPLNDGMLRAQYRYDTFFPGRHGHGRRR